MRPAAGRFVYIVPNEKRKLVYIVYRRALLSSRAVLAFYCKLDVKNDALINLADNLKTKGLCAIVVGTASLG